MAWGDYQTVLGYNSKGDSSKLFILGNGKSGRSNAFTVDWDGNAWFTGFVECTHIILKSSTEGSTKRFKITVDDSGTLTATAI